MKRFLFIFLFFIGSFELIFGLDGVCENSYDGRSFYSLTESSNLCSNGTVASFVSASSDFSGWSWTCLGTGAGNDDSCSATKTATKTPSITSLQVESSSIWYNSTLLKRGSCRYDSRTGKLTVSTQSKGSMTINYQKMKLFVNDANYGSQDILYPFFFNSFRKSLIGTADIEIKAFNIFGMFSVSVLRCSVKNSWEFNEYLDLFEEEVSDTPYYKADEVRNSSFFEVNSVGDLFFRNTSNSNIKLDNVDSSLVDVALNLHNLYEIESAADGLKKLGEILTLNTRHALDVKSMVEEKDNCYEGVFARFNYSSDKAFKLDNNRTKDKIYNNYLSDQDVDKCDNTADQKLRSKIKISLVNITRNLTVYQILPKYLIDDISGINFVNDGGAQRFISDKDPIIGWYFNDSIDNGEIILELPGNSSGGTVILAEEPILFNDGEIIVNYRVSSCNIGEVNIFDVVSLDGSKIYAPGTSFYKVCVTHLTEELELGSGGNFIHAGSYVTSGNYSANDFLFGKPVDISVERTDLYWNWIISKENPSGSYSCLGSIDNLSSSLFGDCLFNEDNRIWLHLGEDLLNPVTTLSTLYLSHTVPVVLNADDDVRGSGVEKIYYCVDYDGTCDPLSGTMILGDEANIQVTCSGLTGCVKFVNFLSVDFAGNVEVVNSESIKMIDAGSSCQADCTVKPEPGRYLAECNGLNLCTYYKFDVVGLFDNGDYVSNQCDLAVLGSYVKFNSSHEILCPSGPFRESIFVDDLLDLSNSFCNNLHFQDYPVIIDGQSVIMKLYSCLDD
jgi:archaellum component FlaF (FlaF/FlaG flagellin family)